MWACVQIWEAYRICVDGVAGQEVVFFLVLSPLVMIGGDSGDRLLITQKDNQV